MTTMLSVVCATLAIWLLIVIFGNIAQGRPVHAAALFLASANIVGFFYLQGYIA